MIPKDRANAYLPHSHITNPTSCQCSSPSVLLFADQTMPKKFNCIFNLSADWNTTTRCWTTWKRKRWRTWWLPVKTLGCRTLSFSVDLSPSWEKGKLRQLIASVGHVLEAEKRRRSKIIESKRRLWFDKSFLVKITAHSVFSSNIILCNFIIM